MNLVDQHHHDVAVAPARDVGKAKSYQQKCYELFRCNFVDALDALQRGLGEAEVLYLPDQEYALAAFQFR